MPLVGEDEYEIPLRDQRFFGAGIKRKRIQFVPSTVPPPYQQSSPANASTTVADRYRALVLKDRKSVPPSLSGRDEDKTSSKASEAAVPITTTCEICNRPISTADSASSHDSSIVHQFCLKHSHPPSSIDRWRKGLAVLTGQGWDPDSRRGLGVEGEGILHPIKAIDNTTRAGLGARAERLQKVQKPVKLDAGKVRLMEKEGKKKAERIREAFYRDEDVLRYLGE